MAKEGSPCILCRPGNHLVLNWFQSLLSPSWYVSYSSFWSHGSNLHDQWLSDQTLINWLVGAQDVSAGHVPRRLMKGKWCNHEVTARVQAQFEIWFHYHLQKLPIKKGALVSVQNPARDAGLEDKYTCRYSGPYIVHQQIRNEAYVLKELDGTFMRQGFASFRLLPY